MTLVVVPLGVALLVAEPQSSSKRRTSMTFGLSTIQRLHTPLLQHRVSVETLRVPYVLKHVYKLG